MDKLEQIKETIEGSAELLDKQPEYNLHLDELIRIISDNDRIINSVQISEDWPGIPGITPNPLRYYNEWKLDTDVNNYWDRWYHTDIRPTWASGQITRFTPASVSVSTMLGDREEWCDFVTDDAIPF